MGEPSHIIRPNKTFIFFSDRVMHVKKRVLVLALLALQAGAGFAPRALASENNAVTRAAQPTRFAADVGPEFVKVSGKPVGLNAQLVEQPTFGTNGAHR